MAFDLNNNHGGDVFNKKRLVLMATLLAAAMGYHSAAFAYGEAGCGPGSVIFKKNSLSSQTLAGTTNNYLGVIQTTAITFNTSGCTATWSQYKNEDRERMEFVASNYWTLKSEVARGQGETLFAFQELYGCGSAQRNQMMQQTRTMLGTEFNPDTVAKQSLKISNMCLGGNT